MISPLLIGSYGLTGLITLILLLIIGIIVIIFVAKVLIFILPAAIVAIAVWWLTGGNEVLAGISFLVVCVISIVRR